MARDEECIATYADWISTAIRSKFKATYDRLDRGDQSFLSPDNNVVML